MDSPLIQMQVLAAAAIAHAKDAHGELLSIADCATADRILWQERSLATESDHEMLAAIYGAWLGQSAVDAFGARWTGLSESQSPRLNLAGVLCSPIDAVHRILTSHLPMMSMVAMAERMRSWADIEQRQRESVEQNMVAWDQLADDTRFAGEMPMPPNATAALAAIDPWLAEIWRPGMKLLCLGAGGGRQGPLHAIAGADVTVVDISRRQLEHDRIAAARLGLTLSLVQASADQLIGIQDSTFDVVVQPVSACYLKNIRSMYAEIHRVLKSGGVYLVQHKQPLSLLLKGTEAGDLRLESPFIEGQSLPVIGVKERHQFPTREPGTIEYTHSLQSLIGDLCAAGFAITHFSEPPRADAFAPIGTAAHYACFVPPYMKLKAVCLK